MELFREPAPLFVQRTQLPMCGKKFIASTVPSYIHAMDGWDVSSQHDPTAHGGGGKAAGAEGNRSRMRTCEEIF
jgi:hypothetical protein